MVIKSIVVYSMFFLSLKTCTQLHKDTTYKTENKSNTVPRSDGIYSTYDTSENYCTQHYYTYNHINIINDSNIMFNNGMGSSDNHFLKIKSYENMNGICGKYVIIENTIYATDVPIGLLAWGGRMKLYYANFKGTIKNSDTISDWKMIPPYPKANKRLNDNFKFETTPKLLYFIESKELSGLDSLYRKKLKENEKKKN